MRSILIAEGTPAGFRPNMEIPPKVNYELKIKATWWTDVKNKLKICLEKSKLSCGANSCLLQGGAVAEWSKALL